MNWWPDWSGKAVAIIASGPSAKQTNIAALRGVMPVLAIKENSELAPWADVVYGCDAAWWRNVNGLPKYNGLKISQDRSLAARFQDMHIVEVQSPRSNDMLFDRVGLVGAGGNSGFQALNLACQFGANRVMLIGYDMSDRSGVHWYGRNSGMGRNNPNENNFQRWRAAFTSSAATLTSRGIDVVNVSPISELRCFRKQTLELTLQQWGLCEDDIHRVRSA